MTIALIDTGVANVASVAAALRRTGAEVERTRDPARVEAAPFVVLPGVGAFGPGMAALQAAGLTAPLRRRLADQRPTLAVCLGLQLLAEASEESPGIAGLGWLPDTVSRLPDRVRVPHLGWNAVAVDHPEQGPLTSGIACYANSYGLSPEVDADQVATTVHGRPFLAAIARGRVLACQFHPELSGRWGAALLQRWLTGEPALATPAPASGLRPRIVPCLDIRDGRVVKGVQFQGLRDAGDPVALAAAYDAQGADELVILDVSATPEGRRTAAETVAAVRQVLTIPLTVGGGVRQVADAERLLAAGADKVAVNTAAVRRPAFLTELATRFGQQCTVLSLDAARTDGGWSVVVRSGTERQSLDAIDWARQAVDAGAGEVLLTSWDRDGTRQGYDLALLEAVSQAVPVPVVASGGADGPTHLADGLHAGADAVLAASIFHDGDFTVGTLKQALAARGVAVRPPRSTP